MGHEATVGDPAVPRPIYTDPEIAGVGLTEAQAREEYGDDVVIGRCPWAAIARAVMSGDTTGWVKTIHEGTYGELLGVVIVGPHATDLIGEAVVALDAESTIETSPTASRPIRPSPRGSRRPGSSRSAARSTSRRSARSRVGSGNARSQDRAHGAFGWWFARRWLSVAPRWPSRRHGRRRRPARPDRGVARLRRARRRARCRRLSSGEARAAGRRRPTRPRPPAHVRPSRRRPGQTADATRPATRGCVTPLAGTVTGLVRPALEGLVPYEPGKPVETVQRELGLSRVVKLASNEGPFGPFPEAIEAIERALPEREPLPRRRLLSPPRGARRAARRRLRRGRRRRRRRRGDRLRLPGDARPGRRDRDPVAVVPELRPRSAEARCRDGARRARRAAGSTSTRCSRPSPTRTKLAFLPTVNNPTGTAITSEELRRFVAGSPSTS